MDDDRLSRGLAHASTSKEVQSFRIRLIGISSTLEDQFNFFVHESGNIFE